MSFEHYSYKDRNFTQVADGLAPYTEFLMEESIMLENEHHSNKAKRKNKKRKWREIEAIKEEKRLRRELNALDYDYDFSDDEL